jgi:hypothetical protein
MANVLPWLAFTLSLLAFLAVIGLVWQHYRNLSARQRLYNQLEHPENLEEIIVSITRKLSLAEQQIKQLTETQNNEQNRLKDALKLTGLVRYNSQAAEGGNLSFSLALLSERGDGLVLTSLHGRDNNRIYSKAVNHFTSTTTLSDEEQRAISTAKQLL